MDNRNTKDEFGGKMQQALKDGDQTAFKEIYAAYFPMIAQFIYKNRGDQEDARDIFQEGLFVLVKKMREPDFELTAKLSTLLFAICRNIWYKKSGRNRLHVMEDEGLEMISNLNLDEDNRDEQELKEQLLTSVSDKLDELEKDCKQVIMLSFYQNKSQVEIAQIMGYSESFVKVKKFRCLEYLRKKVSSLTIFKDLLK